MGIALGIIAIKTGLVTQAMATLKGVMLAVTANPLVLVAAAAIAATLAIAHLVRTTQTGQEIMLQVTANIAYSFQQIGAILTNLLGIGKWVLSRLAMVFQSFLMGIIRGVEYVLEKLAIVSDSAAEALEWIREKGTNLTKSMGITEDWGDEGLKKLNAELEANTKFYYEYGDKIPEIAAENLAENKEEPKLTGFLEEILEGQKNAPGTKNNPANVKGKVAIDGEYTDIIKRSAGAEIVNRYTTMRPTVNAKFGDINQINARDVLQDLVTQMERAKGAALAEAQAQGA